MKRVLVTVGVLIIAVAVAAWNVVGPKFSVPNSISPEAQQAFDERFNTLESRMMRALASMPDNDDKEGWAELQEKVESSVASYNKQVVDELAPAIIETAVNGIPVLDIRPDNWRDNGKVLVYLHGGAYVFYSAASTLLSSVSMAHETGIRVISVDYTLAPHANFEEVQQEVLQVLRLFSFIVENYFVKLGIR